MINVSVYRYGTRHDEYEEENRKSAIFLVGRDAVEPQRSYFTMICNEKPRLPDGRPTPSQAFLIKGNELALPRRAGSRQRLAVITSGR